MSYNIMMVYDATRSGFNRALWAPWFPIPAILSHLRSMVAGTFMSDCDVGDIFLNFKLGPELHSCASIDLTCLFLKKFQLCILLLEDIERKI